MLHNNQLYDSNGNRLYDTLVFFHNEYISLNEYYNMLQFISAGGNVVITDGNAFYAEVNYNTQTNRLTLISGHGFEFDGNSTNRFSRFGYYGFFSNNLNMKYIGSDDCNYHTGNFTGGTFNIDPLNPNPVSIDMISKGYSVISPNYKSAEENCLLTKNAQVIVDWNLSAPGYGRGFKVYETLPVGPFGGSLIHMGIYSTNEFLYDKPLRTFFIDLVRHQMGYFSTPWIRYPINGGVYNSNDLVIDFTPYSNNKVFLNGSLMGNLPPKSSLGYLPEGTYNLTVVFNMTNKNTVRTSIFTIDRTSPQIIFSNNNESISNHVTNPLTVKIDDSNPEDFSYCLYSENYLSSTNSLPIIGTNHITDNKKSLETNLTLNLANGTTYLDIKAYDSAGNENETTFQFAINSTIKQIYQLKQTKIEQINETTVKISVNKPGFNLTPYILLSPQLIIGNNLSSWSKYYFTNYDPVTQEYYLYYTKENISNYFLIKLFVYNSTFVKYIPNLKYFYWYDNFITIKPQNLFDSIAKNNQIIFHISNEYKLHQNGSISLFNIDNISNSLFSTSFSSIEKNYSVIFSLPSLKQANYSLLVKLFSKNNMAFQFLFSVTKIINPVIVSSELATTQKNNKKSLDFSIVFILAIPVFILIKKRKLSL